ncbi:MAG: DUF362 domain-containing protein [Thermodesulfobacteriota bacterium]
MTFSATDTTIYTCRLKSFEENLGLLLDRTGLLERLSGNDTILIKPNLVEALEPPITTPVLLVELLIDYLRNSLSGCRIIIGEGTGSLQYDTHHNFSFLGYSGLAEKMGVELIDLNEEELIHKENVECSRWPEMYLPRILDEVFLLSVPVLKAHTLAKVTLTMKNMMGCPPPKHYQGGGYWGKSKFHHRVHEAIFDLNRYRCPDFTLLDASIGMAQAHLWGNHCNPPVNRLVAGWDPVAIDAYGASLLGFNWQDIDHIRLAHEVLGLAEPLQVCEVE